MKRIILISILSLIYLGTTAQEKFLKDVSETQELSMTVVRLFNENKISESFDELKPYWPIPHNEIDEIQEKTIKYLNILKQRFGESIGTQKVRNEKISDIALRETYFIKYKNIAIRLIFTYYKNDEGWIVNAFSWDDSFEEEFEKDNE